MTSGAPWWRRSGALTAGVMAGLLLLTGCSDGGETGENGEDAAAEENPSSLLPEAEGTTEYPLTVDTWAGETVIEERPERIAVIGFSSSVDVLESLDVTPVYTLSEDAEWEWRDQEWFSQIENVDSATRSDPTNFEGIAAADPDLIIAVNWVPIEDDFDRLTEIAPVLAEEEFQADKLDWREPQRLVGEALDLSAAADESIVAAEDAIAETAVEHSEYEGKTITIAYDYGQEYGIEYYTVTGGTAEDVVLDLGFEPNPLAEEFTEDPTVSEENQALLDGDVLVMIYSDEDGRETREDSALFQELEAVQESHYASLAFNEDDKVVSPDGTEKSNAVWVLRRGASALSVPWAVDVIADQWLDDVDIS